jgi:hypothetical protein
MCALVRAVAPYLTFSVHAILHSSFGLQIDQAAGSLAFSTLLAGGLADHFGAVAYLRVVGVDGMLLLTRPEVTRTPFMHSSLVSGMEEPACLSLFIHTASLVSGLPALIEVFKNPFLYTCT